MSAQSQSSNERRGLVLRAVAGLVLAFLTGMAARTLFVDARPSSDTRSVHTGSGTEASSSPGPEGSRAGIPFGFARSETGAQAAAVSYVMTGQTLIDLPPTRVADAVRMMAAAASADRQVDEANEELGHLRDVLADGSGPIRFLQSVLATRIDAFSRSRARVSVWSVGVLSRSGAVQPQAGWTTSTFEFVWERGDWKVWSETIAPGPTPSLNAGAAPASSRELDRALNGFTPWEATR